MGSFIDFAKQQPQAIPLPLWDLHPDPSGASLDDLCFMPTRAIPTGEMPIHGDDCWHCRLLRKKAAIATVGFEVGLVEFDWPAHRSVRIVVDDPTYFQQPGAQFILDRTGQMFEVFAVDGDGLRCVPR